MPEESNMGLVEYELMMSLNRVEPRQEFVSRLKERLLSPSHVQLEVPSRITPFIPAVGGVLAGVLIFWVVRRIANYFTQRS